MQYNGLLFSVVQKPAVWSNALGTIDLLKSFLLQNVLTADNIASWQTARSENTAPSTHNVK